MFTGKPLCRFCLQANKVRKHGTARSGHQRYLCTECRRTFQLKYIYQAYKHYEEKEVVMTSTGGMSGGLQDVTVGYPG
ncbi:hypothetical protein SOASR030_00780 [Leminorella grimontii]|uniref:Transposase and inactivated derivatives n=1 Tax=Leminorella grimontii TaxID=82981 RepID=A0AAV5MVV2_9GAMM|nr:hypothetical protein [Leminorella grimontii]GKX53966.1 hypothetical protein SOASR030_00780 [Leminorella grimontii]VFS60451.1 Transposase and inactivated derivatives [Leminorella grimontii]